MSKPPENVGTPDPDFPDLEQEIHDLHQLQQSEEDRRKGLEGLMDLAASRNPALAKAVHEYEEAKARAAAALEAAPEKSDRELAEQAGVDLGVVGAVRRERERR